MTPTEYLFRLAEQEGVAIEWFTFEGINGVYLSSTNLRAPIIGLEKSLESNQKLLRCTLAHELGHHFRTAGQQEIFASFKNVISYNKSELMADKWALDILLPREIFMRKLSSGIDLLSLADYFWVTEDFIHKRIKHVQSQGLV